MELILHNKVPEELKVKCVGHVPRVGQARTSVIAPDR